MFYCRILLFDGRGTVCTLLLLTIDLTVMFLASLSPDIPRLVYEWYV